MSVRSYVGLTVVGLASCGRGALNSSVRVENRMRVASIILSSTRPAGPQIRSPGLARSTA